MTDGGGTGRLVTIRILGLPMADYRVASEHGDELMRELALIAAARSEGADVPTRLTALVTELRGRFAGFTLRPDAELAEALARHDTAVDLEYTVPPEAAEAAADLGALLDEADEFCRSGDLLTLATPPDALAFRLWFLGEFVRQASGLPPTPWPDWKGPNWKGPNWKGPNWKGPNWKGPDWKE